MRHDRHERIIDNILRSSQMLPRWRHHKSLSLLRELKQTEELRGGFIRVVNGYLSTRRAQPSNPPTVCIHNPVPFKKKGGTSSSFPRPTWTFQNEWKVLYNNSHKKEKKKNSICAANHVDKTEQKEGRVWEDKNPVIIIIIFIYRLIFHLFSCFKLKLNPLQKTNGVRVSTL